MPVSGAIVMNYLTELGLTIVDQVTTEHVANESALLSALTMAEHRTLNGLVRKLLIGFEPEPG